MEPLNRPNRNREEANGESMIPVERQPDDLRTRIANAIWEELRTQHNLVNFDRLADAVIAELHLRQEFSVEYTPEGEYPPQRQRYEWSCGHERVTEHRDQAEFDAKSFYEEEPEEQPHVVHRYVTEWTADE